MANNLFSKGLEHIWKGDINWAGDDIRVVLYNHGSGAPDIATAETLADLSAGNRVATSSSLTGTTVTAGVVTADNPTYTLLTGSTVHSLIIYKHTGVESTSFLIGYIDTTTDSSLPYTPVGIDATIVWNPTGIIRIV